MLLFISFMFPFSLLCWERNLSVSQQILWKLWALYIWCIHSEPLYHLRTIHCSSERGPRSSGVAGAPRTILETVGASAPAVNGDGNDSPPGIEGAVRKPRTTRGRMSRGWESQGESLNRSRWWGRFVLIFSGEDFVVAGAGVSKKGGRQVFGGGSAHLMPHQSMAVRYSMITLRGGARGDVDSLH